MHKLEGRIRPISLRLIFLVGLICFCGGCSSSRTTLGGGETPPPGPAQVVKQYCHLDYEGVRLQGGTAAQDWRLVAWEEEPGWDTTTIVSGFRLIGVNRRRNEATVRVMFSVLGRWEADRLIVDTRPETIEFEMRQTDSVWRIERPMIAPHVSPQRVREHIRKLIDTEADPARKRTLENVLQRLEALSK